MNFFKIMKYSITLNIYLSKERQEPSIQSKLIISTKKVKLIELYRFTILKSENNSYAKIMKLFYVNFSNSFVVSHYLHFCISVAEGLYILNYA